MRTRRRIRAALTCAAIVMGSVAISEGTAAAGPVSHTDCSRAFDLTWFVAGGESGGKQYAWGQTYNFNPGGVGYSGSTGWVTCDSRTHQVYLYTRNLFIGSWQYHSGSTAFNGGLASVYKNWPCGVSICRGVKLDHYESGYNWYDYKYG